MLTPPDLIAGRYRVLGEAGRGGMGSVYHCVDERLDREVAVKQVGRMPGESVTDQARALREARSTAALNHPHVVSVYDAVAEDEHIWLVMEYVPGRTLARMVREDGPLSPARAAWIGAQVADGLAAAHERGTVHRDVKPGNVLIADGDHAKISDFGIARTSGDPSLTQTGALTGTPGYFAPEVARGADPGPAADVWALGATLYAAVEGRPAYDAKPNPLAVLAAIADQPPPTPERAGPLTEPITRMLDRDPGTRWSMSDVARALHDLHDRSTSAPETATETRNLTATSPVVPEPREPTDPSGDSVPAAPPRGSPGRRSSRTALLVACLVLLLATGIGALLLLDRGREDPPTAEGSPTDPSPSETSPTQDPQPEGSPDEAEPPTDNAPETSTDAQPGGTEPAAFVEDYYGVLPENTEAGYERLSPSYQQQTSYGDYDGFWSTVDDVAVEGTSPAGPRAVDVTLVYNGSEREVRRIYLERGDDGWLIADDEVVG